MRTLRKKCRFRGLSLMEVTLAMTLTMLISGTIVTMVAQQVTFMRMLGEFSFLREEAPLVNSLLARVFSQSNYYRIYAAKSDAFSEVGPVNSGGSAVHLRFVNPDGSMDRAVIAFEVIGGDAQLNYYHYVNGTGWPDTATWTITSKLAYAVFSDSTGVLTISLTGKAQEQITYVAAGD